MVRNLTFSDRLLSHADNALKTLTPSAVKAKTPSPSVNKSNPELTEEQKKHIIGLMRINHTGEVCAQALYQGQALTAKLPNVRESMTDAADEELDHLAWCDERLNELGGRSSVLNPAFYAASFSLGALAGIAGDRYSLGFVAETEAQVSAHLEKHLNDLGEQDERSRAIIEKMLADEERHAENARDAGGIDFPKPVKTMMTAFSKVMTASAYRI